MVGVGIISVLLLLFTIIYVIFKLRKDSISKDIVSVIFKRHLLQIVAVLLCDAYSWVGYVYYLMHPEELDDNTGLVEVYGANPPVWLCILKIFYIFPGFIMPLVRLSEPLFYKIIWQQVTDFLCMFQKRKDEQAIEKEDEINYQKRRLPSLVSNNTVAKSINSEWGDDGGANYRSTSMQSDVDTLFGDDYNDDDEEDESVDPKEERMEDLVPQYLLFASSLNFELVYIILKSIISFSHINLTEEGRIHSESGNIRIHKDTNDRDTVIEIKSFKVKD